jgi:hypothetical protein
MPCLLECVCKCRACVACVRCGLAGASIAAFGFVTLLGLPQFTEAGECTEELLPAARALVQQALSRQWVRARARAAPRLGRAARCARHGDGRRTALECDASKRANNKQTSMRPNKTTSRCADARTTSRLGDAKQTNRRAKEWAHPRGLTPGGAVGAAAQRRTSSVLISPRRFAALSLIAPERTID